MSHSGDIDDTSIGGGAHFLHFKEHYFSVNFHFLKNGKRYHWDFFTIDTIDDGLSFDAIKSILSLDNICLVLYTIYHI